MGGDAVDPYVNRTECVAGVPDLRFEEPMPDMTNWRGSRKIYRLVPVGKLKFDAISRAGIEVMQRMNIPDPVIPADAQVKMDAKIAAGYFTPGTVPDAE